MKDAACYPSDRASPRDIVNIEIESVSYLQITGALLLQGSPCEKAKN
jgi:hypothetical protein